MSNHFRQRRRSTLSSIRSRLTALLAAPFPSLPLHTRLESLRSPADMLSHSCVSYHTLHMYATMRDARSSVQSSLRPPYILIDQAQAERVPPRVDQESVRSLPAETFDLRPFNTYLHVYMYKSGSHSTSVTESGQHRQPHGPAIALDRSSLECCSRLPNVDGIASLATSISP